MLLVASGGVDSSWIVASMSVPTFVGRVTLPDAIAMSRQENSARSVLAAIVGTIVVVALVLLLVGSWPRVAEATPVRVMPLGDSITAGYNVPGGYRIQLEDLLVAEGYGFDFVGSRSNGPHSLADRQHEGHSGLRIDELATLVDVPLARHQPDVVLLLIGTNDMLQRHRLAQAPQRLSALIDRIAARAPSATLLVSSLTPLTAPAANERVRSYNAAIPALVSDKVAHGKRVVFVDMHSALSASDLADGVHPNVTGYRKMAAVWREALPPASALEPPSAIAARSRSSASCVRADTADRRVCAGRRLTKARQEPTCVRISA